MPPRSASIRSARRAAIDSSSIASSELACPCRISRRVLLENRAAVADDVLPIEAAQQRLDSRMGEQMVDRGEIPQALERVAHGGRANFSRSRQRAAGSRQWAVGSGNGSTATGGERWVSTPLTRQYMHCRLPSCQLPADMAEAPGSRTQPPRRSGEQTGFEDREGHRAPFASTADRFHPAVFDIKPRAPGPEDYKCGRGETAGCATLILSVLRATCHDDCVSTATCRD